MMPQLKMPLSNTWQVGLGSSFDFMKLKLLLLAIVLPLLSINSLAAPTSAEEGLFDIKTVQVPVVSWSTNIEDGQVVVTSETNWHEAYDFQPGQTANAIIQTGTNIGDLFGVGGVIGTLLSLVFGVWAKLRSNTNRKTAAVLAQVIEAGRKVMGTTPQGKQLESQWVAWMSKRQTETGVVLEVSKLIKQVVDKESAQLVADELIKMTQKVQPPAPKPPPKK